MSLWGHVSRAGLCVVGLLLGCAAAEQEDDSPIACEALDEVSCEARPDCASSEVNVFRLDHRGACQRVSGGVECLERVVVTAGCAGIGCGDAAPWTEERADTGMALATPQLCGEGFVDWRECEERDGEVVPAICSCTCEF